MFDNIRRLPSIYKNPNQDRTEKELIKSILPKYLLLKSLERRNTGKKTALLISNTDGCGRYSPRDHEIFFLVGSKYKSLIGRDAVLFDYATSIDLRAVIQDKEFADIFVIGHASYHSWMASDKRVDWFDLGEMVDNHLKDGIFANSGCGEIKSWNMIPLGYFVVTDHLNLFGHEATFSYIEEEWYKLKSFRRVPTLDSLVSIIEEED